MTKIVPIIFDGVNKKGDFKWMIKQEKYKDCLFIFNEDIERYNTTTASQGNACVRNYNQFSKYDPPRSIGVITGSYELGGFETLNADTKKFIDFSLHQIRKLIKKYNYRKIYYSAEEDGKLGTSIFVVGTDVIDYITENILKL